MRPRKSSTGVGVSECWRGRGPRQHPVTPTPVTALPFKRLPPWGYRVGVRGGCGRHAPPHKPSGDGWGKGPQPAPLPLWGEGTRGACPPRGWWWGSRWSFKDGRVAVALRSRGVQLTVCCNLDPKKNGGLHHHFTSGYHRER